MMNVGITLNPLLNQPILILFTLIPMQKCLDIAQWKLQDIHKSTKLYLKLKIYCSRVIKSECPNLKINRWAICASVSQLISKQPNVALVLNFTRASYILHVTILHLQQDCITVYCVETRLLSYLIKHFPIKHFPYSLHQGRLHQYCSYVLKVYEDAESIQER